jgi:hypothetical protein
MARRGVDWISIAVHVFVTLCAAVALSEAAGNADDVLVPAVFGVSAVILEVRRRRAHFQTVPSGLTTGEVEAAGRVEELEQRVADLEIIAHRVADLEERVDFSERLLTQQHDRLLEKGESAR